jgi:hypothetical protein
MSDVGCRYISDIRNPKSNEGGAAQRGENKTNKTSKVFYFQV